MKKHRRITLLIAIAITMFTLIGCGQKKLSAGAQATLDDIVARRSTWEETTGGRVDWALDNIKVDSIGFTYKGGQLYFMYGYSKAGDTYSITGLESVQTSYRAVYGVYQYSADGEMNQTTGDLTQMDLLVGLDYKYNPNWTDEELRTSLEKMYRMATSKK